MIALRTYTAKLIELLPTADVSVVREVDFDTLGLPSEEDRREGFTDNQAYFYLGEVRWERARASLVNEHEALAESRPRRMTPTLRGRSR
ncbi:MAG: hypothetical protein CYG61_05465 [Actinobacteria bacterium]|nr:MAG: hypothetical protein CYG61_05465 [Actinomycetota bacterium]